MTTIESYYLAICVAAFLAFALSLAYSSWSWRHWQTTANATPEPVAQVKPQTKLAA